jgi:hypothetical protein
VIFLTGSVLGVSDWFIILRMAKGTLQGLLCWISGQR